MSDFFPITYYLAQITNVDSMKEKSTSDMEISWNKTKY